MKQITLFTAVLFAALSLTSCKGKAKTNTMPVQADNNGMAAKFLKASEKAADEKSPAEEQKTAASSASINFEQTEPLYKTTERHGFKMGAVISYHSALNAAYTNMLKEDFNSITASNEFKAYSLLNQGDSMRSANGMPAMNYSQADTIAKFAQENGIGIRGHVLVWDAYMPVWFFKEGYKNDGAFVDSDTMKKRLEYYIDEVVSHFETNFPGVVYCWDVVNEAVADGDNEWIPGNEFHIRQTRGGSINRFNEILGPDYVKYAFKCARQTVNKVNPNIKLFYNDYNTFYQDKRDAIIRLIKDINKEEKLCDGLGMQGYIGGYGQQAGCMNNNDISLVKTAIKMYSALGLEVQLTEVAVRNYDQTQMEKHAKFYGNLFRAVISAINEGANFTGFTIWGITDNPSMPKNDYSYKMNGPYCGLYDQYYQPKNAYKEVYKALSE